VVHAIGLLVLISLLSFVFLHLAPGNYTDAMRLDARISPETLSAWRSAGDLIPSLAAIGRSGEFGFSFGYGIPVGSLLWPRIKNTLFLTTLAFVVSWSAALPIGVAEGNSAALDPVLPGKPRSTF
jgi:peptide/nickel transport system permease protein